MITPSKDNKYKVPNDISVIGFDDIKCGILNKPIVSTIKVDKIELGIEAMKLIMDVIENNDLSTQKKSIPVELVIRESTRKIQ